jgi:hypothetical protein
MIKKYELTNETKVVLGRTLYRIRAIKDFGNVKRGDLGGFIEGEENLAHIGNAWIGENAWVFGNTYVYGNAYVHENACIYGKAEIGGNAEIYG